MRTQIGQLFIVVSVILISSLADAESRYKLTPGVSSENERQWVYGRGTVFGDADPWRSCQQATKTAEMHLRTVLEQALPGFTPPDKTQFPIRSVSFSAGNLACTVVVGITISRVEQEVPQNRTDMVRKLLHLP